jgi:hypothetical protein
VKSRVFDEVEAGAQGGIDVEASAQYILVDVSGVTDMHPNDVRNLILDMLDSGEFGVADAADGYLLLSRNAAGGATSRTLPDVFFDFARAGDGRPQHPLNIRFGDSLRLLGYDIEDDPKWRQTRYRFYWQTLVRLPEDTTVVVRMLRHQGAIADDTLTRPMPAMLWYPPARWRPNELVVTETVPWYLPRSWAPVIEVSAGGQKLLPYVQEKGGEAVLDSTREQVRLGPRERRGGKVVSREAPGEQVKASDVAFAGEEWAVSLTGYAAPKQSASGRDLPVVLRWEAEGPSTDQMDYTVFLHLRDASGQTVVNADAAHLVHVSAHLPVASWGSTDLGCSRPELARKPSTWPVQPGDRMV